jgi:DNA invertase Pin-like site-specific DNA recombinase
MTTIRPVCSRARPLNTLGARKRPQNDAKTAVAYLRVSTDRQEHGPEAQRATLEAWAGREGVQIIEWFSEEESGATEIDERPELQAALEAVYTHKTGLLLAAKRDRLAREVTIAREIGARVRARGGMVVTADGMSDVENRPDTFLKQGISDLFAEHERRQIADRTRQALGVMHRKGFRTGNTPYGFRAARQGPVSKTSGRPLPLEFDAAEQEICTYIIRLHEQGWGPRRIERELSDRRLLSRAGRPFHLIQVQRIIAGCERLREVFPEHARGRPQPVPIAPPRIEALACGRGHVHEDARAEGSYCTRGDCAAERGTFLPARRIERRKL